jgi:hypothetical protein
MTDTGFLTSGTQANDGTGTVAWLNLGNVNASDNAYATCVLAAGQTSQGALLTNFGFSVPSNAIILGVEVSVERSQSVASRVNDNTVQLIKGGTPGGTNKAAAGFWPATDTVLVYGASNDLWGNALTAADVNASNFGLKFRVNEGAGASTAQVDLVQLKVYYQQSSVSADGTGAATWTGKAQIRGAVSSAGVGTATWVGKNLFRAAVSAAGTGAATWVGKNLFRASATMAGTSTASWVSKALKKAVLTATGTGAANWINASTGAVSNGAGAVYRIIYRNRRGRR